MDSETIRSAYKALQSSRNSEAVVRLRLTEQVRDQVLEKAIQLGVTFGECHRIALNKFLDRLEEEKYDFPEVENQPKTKCITVRVNSMTLERIQKICIMYGVSRSHCVREAIFCFLEGAI
ncbi:arc repressoR/DNA compleX-DNA compleX [Caudoviricetes sp.]|nr:arc repressoR/DNA compleX-DNA compleX [Caudoviricetes sp.]